MEPEILRSADRHESRIPEGAYISELSNVEADGDVSIAQARVKPGQTTLLHLLRGVDERYVILEGAGRVEVGDMTWEVEPRDVVRIPRDVAQRITNTGDTDLVFLCVCTPRFVPHCYVALEPEEEA